MSRATILLLIAFIDSGAFAFFAPAPADIRSRWRPLGLSQKEGGKRHHTPSASGPRQAKRGGRPVKGSRAKKKRQSLESLLELETELRGRGFRHVIGSDDSGGAGCIAGPVVVASCCLLKPHSSFLPVSSRDAATPDEGSGVSLSVMETLSKVNDCKELDPNQRREIYDVVLSHPDIFAVTTALRSPREIDEINLTRATQEAFAESIEALVEKYNLPFEGVYAIVDGKVSPKLYASKRKQCDSPEEFEEEQTPNIFSVRPYVNGDAHVYTVALASIVARVSRDNMMKELDSQYPLYGFSEHSGYGRKDHIETIHRLGSLEGVHRMSFKQVKGR